MWENPSPRAVATTSWTRAAARYWQTRSVFEDYFANRFAEEGILKDPNDPDFNLGVPRRGLRLTRSPVHQKVVSPFIFGVAESRVGSVRPRGPASPSVVGDGKLKQDGRKLYEYDERGVLVNFTCAAASMLQGAREVFWGECQAPACGEIVENGIVVSKEKNCEQSDSPCKDEWLLKRVGYVSAAEQYQAQTYESICAEPGTCTEPATGGPGNCV